MNNLSCNTKEIIGHHSVLNDLINAYSNQKMAHAWLISGSYGVGKASLVYLLAKKILSTHHKNIDQLVNDNTCSELMVIEKKEDARHIMVEDIRKINKFLSYAIGENSPRIVIIDGCENLNQNSANALLKILEEPPSHAFLFLISNNLNSLPVTVISRCKKIRLAELDFDQAMKVLNLANQNIEPVTATILLKLTQHSPGLALKFEQQNVLKLYQVMLLLTKCEYLDMTIVKEINEQLTLEKWPSFSFLINQLLVKVTKAIFTLPFAAVDQLEESVIEALVARFSKDSIFELWQDIGTLTMETEKSFLDLKTTSLIIFNKLINCNHDK